MGIKNLLRETRSVGVRRHISEYAGQTVGIDGYVWLHRAVYSAGVRMNDVHYLSKFVRYFETRVSEIIGFGLKVVLVFDGDKLLLKNRTQGPEYQEKLRNYDMAMENLKGGNETLGQFQFFHAMDVSPTMACEVQRELERKFPESFECITAPFEADSQLAYLSMRGIVDLVITEDSDLLVFGAKRILYKLDRDMWGVEYQLSALRKCPDYDFHGWSESRFIQFCVMCGCDYLDSPRGIGFKRAYKLFAEHGKVEAVMPKLVGRVPPDYLVRFYLAYFSFKYQRVYCPVMRKEVHLREEEYQRVDEDPYEGPLFRKAREAFGSLDFLGAHHTDSLIRDIAEFRKDPLTKESYLQSFHRIYDNKKRTRAKEGLRKLAALEGRANRKGSGTLEHSSNTILKDMSALEDGEWITDGEDTEEEGPEALPNISKISAIPATQKLPVGAPTVQKPQPPVIMFGPAANPPFRPPVAEMRPSPATSNRLNISQELSMVQILQKINPVTPSKPTGTPVVKPTPPTRTEPPPAPRINDSMSFFKDCKDKLNDLEKSFGFLSKPKPEPLLPPEPPGQRRETSIGGDFTIFSRKKQFNRVRRHRPYHCQDFLMFKLLSGKFYAGGLFVPQSGTVGAPGAQDCSLDAFRPENFESFIQWTDHK